VLEKENYKLIVHNGVGSHTEHVVRCPKFHEYETSYDVFNRGYKCNECRIFYCELMIRSIFEKIFPEHKFSKCRPALLCGLEIDGYCSELNTSFEYNGIREYEFNPHFHRTP
jgi:hypothetical protein